MSKFLVRFFTTILRRKLIVKDDGTKTVKWYQSENILSGLAVAAYGMYTIVQWVAMRQFGTFLPDVPESVLGFIASALGGTIVWSRWTAEAKIEK